MKSLNIKAGLLFFFCFFWRIWQPSSSLNAPTPKKSNWPQDDWRSNLLFCQQWKFLFVPWHVCAALRFLSPAEVTLDSGQGSSIFSETPMSQLTMSYSSPAASHQTPQQQQSAQPSYPTASQTTQQHSPFPPQPMVRPTPTLTVRERQTSS